MASFELVSLAGGLSNTRNLYSNTRNLVEARTRRSVSLKVMRLCYTESRQAVVRAERCQVGWPAVSRKYEREELALRFVPNGDTPDFSMIPAMMRCRNLHRPSTGEESTGRLASGRVASACWVSFAASVAPGAKPNCQRPESPKQARVVYNSRRVQDGGVLRGGRSASTRIRPVGPGQAGALPTGARMRSRPKSGRRR